MFCPSRDACLAAAAALVATVGDCFLLYVGNSRRTELGLSPISEMWLWIGCVLGVGAIPFYALGYRVTAHVLKAASRRVAHFVFINGISIGVLGAAIHGITAVYIAFDNTMDGRDPLSAIIQSGIVLPALWGVATIQVTLISALFAWHVGSGRTVIPRCLAMVSPALLTIVLAAIGAWSVFSRSFLIPAAPNIAHLIFFCTLGFFGVGDEKE